MKNCNKIYTDINCNIIISEDFDVNYVNVYFVQHTNAEGVIKSQTLVKTEESDIISFNFGMDGFYTICRIDVPVNPANPYYYRNGRFYKDIREVSLKELYEVNPKISKLNVEYDYYFCTCRLRKCYINACQEIFDKRAAINCNNPNIDSTLIYKRDLLLSTLNVIDYMAEFGLYAEAQRLLERVSGCNGLCQTTKNDCGCGKML